MVLIQICKYKSTTTKVPVSGSMFSPPDLLIWFLFTNILFNVRKTTSNFMLAATLQTAFSARSGQ